MDKLPFGEVQGKDKNGIIAYSCYKPPRDDDSYINTEYNCSTGKKKIKKIYCGIKWQCIEYVRRWLIIMFGISFDQVNQAYMLYKQVSFFNVRTNKHVKHSRHSNFSKTIPHVGSLVIWDKDDKQNTGHVAVVTKVKGDNVYICEQNWTFKKWQSNYSRKMIIQKQIHGGIIRHSLSSNDTTDNIILGWLSLKK